MTDDFTSAVIIDTGSGYCKADIAGEDIPRTVFPTLIGKSRTETDTELDMSGRGRDYYIGHDAQSRMGLLNLSRPIQKGFVKDWDDLEKIWHHLFLNELKIDSTERPVLTTVYSTEQKSTKEKTAQIFFETLSVPFFYCYLNSLLSLYGSGRTTGMIIDSGEEVTSVMPILEGSSQNYAQSLNYFGGGDLNCFLQRLLKDKMGSYDLELIRTIKEDKCYLSNDYEKEIEAFRKQGNKYSTFELPDGNRVKIEEEMIKCSEAIFQPSLVNQLSPGLHHIIYESLLKCEAGVRRELTANIIFCGGNTMIENYVNRMNKELTGLLPASIKFKLVGSTDRNYLTWMGGAVVSS
jgi:actin